MSCGVMVDLETLGVGVKAPIFEIGLVAFDPVSFEATDKMSIAVDIVEQIVLGAEVESGAVEFWRDQGLSSGRRQSVVGLDEAAELVSAFFKKNDPENVWANSPAFDLVLLREMMIRSGMATPWSHTQEMDVRTVRRLSPESPRGVVSHEAVDDCLRQIEMLRAGLLGGMLGGV